MFGLTVTQPREFAGGQGGGKAVDHSEAVPWALEPGLGETSVEEELGMVGGLGARRVFGEEGKHCGLQKKKKKRNDDELVVRVMR